MGSKISPNFIPPLEVAKQAEEGLRLRRKFGRGGTMVGVARARDLKNRRNLSPKTIQRMFSFFSRHFVDKQGRDFYSPHHPSNGRIAWMLWGGDAGAEWCAKLWREIKNNS